MAGTRSWRELRAQHATPEFEAELEQAEAELQEHLAAHEYTLCELRAARRFTRAQIADQLGINPSEVARIEGNLDLYLSTLQRFVEAMGGSLEIAAVFNDHEFPISLSDIINSDTGETQPVGHGDVTARTAENVDAENVEPNAAPERRAG
jgi:transcriptional regulator with XRE-family HTH domain